MKKEYEVIVTSPGSSKLKRYRIKGWVIKLTLYFIVLLFISILLGIVFYGRVYFTALKVKRLEAENRRLKSENMRIVELEKKVERLEVLREKMYKMLGYEKAPKIQPFIDTTGAQEVSQTSEMSTEEEKKMQQRLSPAMADLLMHALREDSITPKGMPTQGVITRGYGPIHKGIDIGAPCGTPVVSTAYGIVDSVYYDIRLGHVVVIKHGYEYRTLYGHLQHVRVYPGKKVKRGEVIGEIGLSGYTTGAHLHYEVHNMKGTQNPIYFLND